MSLLIGSLSIASNVRADEYSISIKEKSFLWKDNEYISGGFITIQGGYVLNFRQTRILGMIHNEPEKTTARINLIYHQPSGSSPDKAGEYPFLKNWFIIKTSNKKESDKQFPFRIDGELFISRAAPSTQYRKVHITNSTFLLQKIQ